MSKAVDGTQLGDYLVSTLGTKIGLTATAATAVDPTTGAVNQSGAAIGIAQGVQGTVDLATKGLQVTSPVWGKTVPIAGGVLGAAGVIDGLRNGFPSSTTDQAGLVANAGAVVAGVAVVAGAPVVAAGAAIVGIGAGVYQIYTRVTGGSTTPDYGNYPTQTANETARLSGLEAAAKAKEQAAIASALTASEASNRTQAAQRAADKAAAEAAAASAAAAAAFRASEIAYTNSQGGGGGSGGWGGWSSGPDQSAAETARLGRSGDAGGGLGFPVILDLGGDGIDLYQRTQSPAHFDFDDDGYSETTAWAGPKDGILVIDEGGDNQITQSKEIAFAKWTAAEDTDLQGLAATFDSNHDGVLDARDTRFADFKVWTDANSNGTVDAGEMQTLAQAGIQSINLKVKDGTAARLDDGSIIHGLFDVQRTDGKTIQGADVALSYNSQGYRTRTDAQGNTLIEFESGGALHYRNMGALEGNANFNLGTDKDATVWIGASGNAGNNVLDASAKTTEVLLDGGAGNDTLRGGAGDDLLVGGEGADNLQGGAGADQLFADAADIAALNSLSGAAKASRIDGGAGYDSLVVTDNAQLNLNVDDIGVEAVVAGSANDTITGTNAAVNYVFGGGAGNDVLTTAGGADLLVGGDGNDTLKAGAGDDVLVGGAGVDRLEGGAGNDTYVFNRGDGADRLLDYAEDWYKEKYTYQENVAYSEQYNYYESVYRGDAKTGGYVNELRSGYRAATPHGRAYRLPRRLWRSGRWYRHPAVWRRHCHRRPGSCQGGR